MKHPWEHLQRPDDTELHDSLNANKAAMQTTQDVIKSHMRKNGDGSIVLEEEAVVDEAVVEEAVGCDPDFYPNRIPVQYHETGLFGWLRNLLRGES